MPFKIFPHALCYALPALLRHCAILRSITSANCPWIGYFVLFCLLVGLFHFLIYLPARHITHLSISKCHFFLGNGSLPVRKTILLPSLLFMKFMSHVVMIYTLCIRFEDSSHHASLSAAFSSDGVWVFLFSILLFLFFQTYHSSHRRPPCTTISIPRSKMQFLFQAKKLDHKF